MRERRLAAWLIFGFFSGAVSALDAPGLTAPAQVTFDEFQVPTITAASGVDAAYVQGYVHAQQRFFQMDVTRRALSGTLAELVGAAALDNDVQLRTLGVRRSAWRTYAALNTEQRARFRAYSNGVNLWLRTHDLPPEYGALEITEAEPWTPVDSLVVAKGLAFQLAFDLDIETTLILGAYQQAGGAAGFDGTALFFNDTHRIAPPDDRVTAPDFLASIGGLGKTATGDSKWEVPPVPEETLAVAKAYRDAARGNPLLARPLGQDSAPDAGSNWWVVSGELSATGAPLLANDPHLALNTPATFVQTHLIATGGDTPFNVAGVSVPGTPGVVQGCNEFLCWGSTVHPMDVTDTFQERLILNTFGLPTHTVYQGAAEPVRYLYQTYRANVIGDGQANNLEMQPVGYTDGGLTLLVPRRNDGPILALDGTTGLSVQYAGSGATFETEAFWRIASARDVFEFRDALQQFDVGSQNFAVADVDGNIAYFVGGEQPVRDDLQNLNAPDGGIPPFLIRDGTGALRHEWMAVENPQPQQALDREILPFDEMPQLVNPERGYIVNANNDPVGVTLDNNALNQIRPGGGLYYLNPGYAAYRMGRIDRLVKSAVAAGEPITLAQVQAWQSNDQMLDAELTLGYLLDAYSGAATDGAAAALAALAADERVGTAVELLAQWDFSSPTGIAEGYDAGDPLFSAQPPDESDVRHSAAATIYALWRSRVIANVIDATLSRVGLSGALPNNRAAQRAVKYHLDNFAANRGVGASGLNFFAVEDATLAPEQARDLILLTSLREALVALAGDEFAPAFANSTDPLDYRWGKLHRIVFDHPLGGPFNLPNPDGAYGLKRVGDLPGVARQGGWEVLDASNHSVRASTLNGFQFGAGPNRRKVASLDPDGIEAYEVIPGGQVGVVGSPHYADQLYLWLVNANKPLLIDPAQAAAAGGSPVQFDPG